jgi:hypothetical protein
MITWQEQLSLMQLVATKFPHPAGRPIAMRRRGKRGRGRLRPAMTVPMRVAAFRVVRGGEQALVDRDRRRQLAPHEVYDMRIRALRLERDDALAAEYGVSQSSATRAIDGDTYRDVPFPIRIHHPDVPIEIYYPYSSAITILTAAPIDQQFTITTQPHTPTLRMSGLLRLADQVWPAPPASVRPPPTTASRRPDPSAQHSPAPTSHDDAPPPRPKPATPTHDAASRNRRKRRFG